MPVTTSNSTIPHSPSVFGDQTTPVTTALSNGGYVVAWSDDSFAAQKDVKFQIYNSVGEAVGGVQSANVTVAGDQVVRDVVATADGKFTILWSTGATITARGFDGATGAPASTEQNLTTLNGLDVSGAQMIVTGGSSVKVEFSSNTTANANTALETATFNTATGVFGAKSTIASNLAANLALSDLKPGNGSDHYALLTSVATSVLVGNNGSSLNLPANTGSLAKIQENRHLLFSEGANGQLSFSLLTGFSTNLSAFSVSSAITLTGVGSSATSQDVLAKTAVDLGSGRILVVWVADGGIGTGSVADGVFGIVFNTITSSFEDSIVRIANLSSAFLAEATLDAQVMADGRVTVAIGTPAPNFSTFSGRDALSIIVDPRIAGVSLTGTAQEDKFVGSAFADTFSNIGANDSVDGGNGIDTVFLATNVARTIDLIKDDRFPEAPSNLANVEIINLGNLDDVLYGFLTADNINGGGGNDLLVLREGADTADGGTGDDKILGGAGGDTLLGNAGNDILAGGADTDTLNGGSGDDSITGGEGNDFVVGGDGIDRLYGNNGDDTIDGGIGNDFITGGEGNDVLLGGADNDTITAGAGDDVIDGGAGSDLINAGSGFNVVDGGTGSDTISYSQVSIAPGQLGVFVDLDPGSDPFGNTDGVVEDDDVLVNIENIFGGNGNDLLFGSGITNVLRGFGGDDTLFGRGNNDVLFGGTGADQFVYDAPGSAGNDQIRDFTVGTDIILIVSAAFGNIHEGNIAASFVSNADATPAANGNPQFLFDNAGGGAGRLFFDSNGNLAGGATLIATLTFTTVNGLTTFGANDFNFL